jgi:hypothetical protein
MERKFAFAYGSALNETCSKFAFAYGSALNELRRKLITGLVFVPFSVCPI